MKRETNNSSNGDQKRLRRDDAAPEAPPQEHSDDPFHASLQRSWPGLLEEGMDERGYLEGKVRMRWPTMGAKPRIQLATDDGALLEVLMQGACSKYSKELSFSIHDVIQLALKGVSIKPSGPGARTSHQLTFERGVIIKFVKAKDQYQTGCVVNTWELDENEKLFPRKPVDPDDWYSTPADPHHARHDVPITTTIFASHTVPVVADTSKSAPSEATSKANSKKAATTSTTRPASRTEASISAVDVSKERYSVPEQIIGAKRPRSPDILSATKRVTLSGESSTSAAKLHSTASAFGVPPQVSHSALRPETPHPSTCEDEPPMAPPPVPVPAPVGLDIGPANKKKRKKAHKKAEKERKAAQQAHLASVTGARSSSASASKVGATVVLDTVTGPSTYGITKSGGEFSTSIRNDTTSTAANACPVPERAISEPASCSKHVDTPTFSRAAVQDSWATDIVAQGASISKTTTFTPASTTVHSPVISSVASCSTIEVAMSGTSSSTAAAKPDSLSTPHLYVPLNAVVERRQQNVVGVVVTAGSVSKTVTNENKIKFTIVDSSNFETTGFNINCFSKADKWLPEPNVGDILILRQIVGDMFMGNFCGTGPSYRAWTWAIFHPRTRKVTAAPTGSPTIPGYQLNEQELQYCTRLADWWKSISPGEKTNTESDTVHHIVTPIRRRTREHRLICDASPQMEPNGFFDCTVEVLQGYDNGNGVYSLYVTDYTRNSGLPDVQRDWCPRQLADKVLKMEMWEEAAAKGLGMTPGEFWFFGNVRMKVSSGGYLEATITDDNKMRRLDEDMLEGEPHFQALLERKHEWEAAVEAGDGEVFPHQLFEEIEPDHHFLCTVEILCISYKNDTSCLFVTDYTYRPDLVPIAPTVPKAALLKGMIVRIDLRSEAQVETAKNLTAGDFIIIRKLRLIRSRGTDQLAGRLGGNERLIHKLQGRESTNGDLKALLRRKTEWDAQHRKVEKVAQPKRAGHVNQAKGKSSVESSSNKNGFKTIREIEADEHCPIVFRTRARIIDFYPSELRRWSVLRCTKCEKDLPDDLLKCPMCDDAMDDESYAKPIYEFFLRVEDEEGSRLHLSGSDIKSTLLRGLDAADFQEDEAAYQEFAKRMRPLLGNLLEVDESGSAQRRFEKDLVPNTPVLALTIGMWPLDDGRSPSARGYILQHHEVVED